ncbi:MAG TPA: hypothetical protein VD866_04515, partial [Urbifossiella sp.]|nr:hypothetical protein [Urbifossiella sp.]
MSTLFAGRACQDPADFYRACTDAEPPLNTSWWGTVNLFRNPAGRGPGAGAILLTKADLDLINFTADNTLSFLDDRRTSNQIELKRITITRFYCLSSGWADDPRAVYLCRLVDRRHFLAQVPIDRAYNVRDADGEEYLPATTTDDGDPWTWADVVADIWGELDEGDAPALPFAPDGAPENLRFHGATAWESLHSVLDRLACTTVLDHTTDTFTIVRLGDAAGAAAVALAAALADMDGDELRTWDAYHGEPDRGRLPEKVRVLFPRRPVPTDGSSPYFAEDVTLAATAGVAAGTYVQLFDDLTAIGSGTPTNAAALTTRAVERAGDWRRKRLGYERRLTLEYRDFRHELKPGETAELTTLRDNGRPMVTLVESGPDGRMEDWRPFVPPLGADLSPAPEAGSCGFHVRKVDCVSFASTTGGSSVAVWDADAVGWVLPAPITTGDGPAVATLVEDDFNRYAVKLVSENATWHLNPTGRCDRTGAAVFRDSYLPLSLQEEPGEGSGSGSGSGVVPCAGETITLALKCVPCSLSC